MDKDERGSVFSVFYVGKGWIIFIFKFVIKVMVVDYRKIFKWFLMFFRFEIIKIFLLVLRMN